MKVDADDKSSLLRNACVLQVIPALDAGGAERTTVEIARGVVDAGGQAIVASNGGRLEADLAEVGVRHVRLPVHSKNPFDLAMNVRRIANLIESEDADIVHARSRAPAWSALAAARRTRAAFVTTHHGAYKSDNALKRLYNSGIARGDAVIANSRFTADQIRRSYPQAADRVAVIPRGADLGRFNPSALDPARRRSVADRWGLSGMDRPFVLLQPTRLTPWKGQKVAIDALARARAAAPEIANNFVLILAGDAQGRDDYVEELQLAIRDASLDDCVNIVGHIDDMPAAFMAADLVLAPSTGVEAFGRIAAEAGAMGRIVIASDCGGLRETIEHQRTGFLVPPGDASALCEAMLATARLTSQSREGMEAAAMRRVRTHFSVESMVNATINLYRDLLARR